MSAPIKPLIFASADYDGLELRTMAQACLLLVGESRLAQVLNSRDEQGDPMDPHLMMAANMLGLPYLEAKARHKAEKKARSEAYEFFTGQRPDASGRFIPRPLSKEEALKRASDSVPTPVDDARQAGKVADFGFPGGLGLEKLVLFARKAYKVDLLVEPDPAQPGKPNARELKRTWLATFPEFRRYFDRIGNMAGADGTITLRHYFSGRVRGGATYTAACNSFFQGLGADATGNAMFRVSEACYVETPCVKCSGAGCEWCRSSGVCPLFGTRIVNYIHDEIMIECEEDRGHEVAHELVRLMIEGAAPYLPDVPASAEPKLMRFWSKDAKQVWAEPGEPDPRDPSRTLTERRLVAWPKAA